jgi:hypothetical protein
LISQAADQFNSFRFLAIRPWQNPRDFTGDPLNIPNLGLPAYNRDEINTNYEECINDPENAGTNGDVIALKLQIDYMAAQENAYRHVRASLPRCMAHAMARRFGQGNGPLIDRIRKEPEDFIRSGGAGAAVPGETLPATGGPETVFV